MPEALELFKLRFAGIDFDILPNILSKASRISVFVLLYLYSTTLSPEGPLLGLHVV